MMGLADMSREYQSADSKGENGPVLSSANSLITVIARISRRYRFLNAVYAFAKADAMLIPINMCVVVA